MATTITLPVEAIRRKTFAAAKELELPINEALPLLDERASTRTADEIVDRLICLNAVTMCACGFDRAQAHAWLSQENLIDKLTPLEKHFIGEDTGKGDLFISQIESIEMLIWTTGIGLGKSPNIIDGGDSFWPTRVPNSDTGESSHLYRTWVRLRSITEIAAACDLAICAQWGIRHATFSQPKMIRSWASPTEMEARRRALEWLLNDQPWKEGPLDRSFGGEGPAQLPLSETSGTSAEPESFREVTRRQSLMTASNLGYPINPELPFVEPDRPKSKDDAVSRLLCLYALAMRAEGVGLRKARAWLKSEGLSKALTRDERIFLEWSNGHPHRFILDNIENIWTLAWALGLVEELDFGKETGDELGALLPNIKKGESSEAIRAKAALRPREEILAACDLADCIHWAIREASLKGWKQSGKVSPYAVTERRRALKWLICDKAWNELWLDT